MSVEYAWHVLPARHWPSSQAEEASFRDQLLTASQDTPRPRRPQDPELLRRDHRSHVTAVLNALRCGMNWEELLAQLPGLNPHPMLVAYDDLQSRRVAAAEAWRRIVSDPDLVVSEPAVAQGAAALMPVVIHRALTRAHRGGAVALHHVITHATAQIAAHTRVSRRIELMLAARTAPDPTAVRLGARLHNVTQPALWSAAHYLPRRVTDLSPTRVADLLNEREQQ